MKKQILLISLVILTVLQCACGSSGDLPDGTDTEALVETDVITEADKQTAEETEEETEKETEAETEDEKVEKISFEVKAESFIYLRGGDNGNKTYEELSKSTPGLLIIKRNSESGSSKNDREIYIQFDLYKYREQIEKVSFADLQFVAKSMAMAPFELDIYYIPEVVELSELTFNNRPLGEKVDGANYVIPSLASYNFMDIIDRAFDECDGFLTLRLVGRQVYTTAESKIECGVGKEPYLLFGKSTTYEKQLVDDEAENKAIWDYAQQMYDEWYGRYQEILKQIEGESKVAPIVSESSQYTMTVQSYGSTAGTKPTARRTRTFDALTDLDNYINLKSEEQYDTYGGLMDPALRQEVTGFFYSKKIGDRWWIIDPLGYPCYVRGVSGITYQYSSGSPNQKRSALEKYGTLENWALSAVARLKDGLYFNATTATNNYVLGVDDPLVEQRSLGGGFVKTYAKAKNIHSSKGGSTTLSENNTMPVFNPDFAEFADTHAKGNTAEHKNKANFIGYTTDNELPMDYDMLTDYLTVDHTKKINYYSYACAWTWLCNMTGKEMPTQADITEEMYELFRGFIWDRYFNVVCTATRKYDPNHMILGTRFLTKVKDAEWVIRFSEMYLDCITINWYHEWEADAQSLADIATFADKPIMITEFYAKAMENEGNLANTDSSAGWLVQTQNDRGYFYQNFTLRLLECKNVVGWHWFQYLDCDPEGNQTDVSSQDSNKGMYSNTHNEYTDLTEKMVAINKNVYRLIDYFDLKYAE